MYILIDENGQTCPTTDTRPRYQVECSYCGTELNRARTTANGRYRCYDCEKKLQKLTNDKNSSITQKDTKKVV